jgi:nucleotide-binding universal stress UspA family protein
MGASMLRRMVAPSPENARRKPRCSNRSSSAWTSTRAAATRLRSPTTWSRRLLATAHRDARDRFGYDGSPESEHAVAVARDLAAQCGAKLSAFEAVSLPTYTFLGGPAPIDDALEGLVDDARKRIDALGGVEPHAAYGHPAEELGVYSASLDLIVGSRGYGPIGRLIHGSTSQQLAHSARCPLLVLTRAARETETPEAAEDGRDTAVALKG